MMYMAEWPRVGNGRGCVPKTKCPLGACSADVLTAGVKKRAGPGHLGTDPKSHRKKHRVMVPNEGKTSLYAHICLLISALSAVCSQ